MLAGLRVIEVPDERVEYTGLLLAGFGAAREHLLRLLDGPASRSMRVTARATTPWPWIAPRSTLASRCW